MEDGGTLLQHLQKNSELTKQLLATAVDAEALKQGFLEMVAANDEAVTSSKIKQVYFPVEEEAESYHLLSVLSHSGHLFEMRKRLDQMRFSESTKIKRELRKNNQYSEAGYQEVYNLTTIGYGGTKPQNISVLNNQNAGKAHLLLSVPPELSSRHIRLPTRNFFTDVLYPKQLQEIFQAFHRLLSADHNNVNIRKGLDYRIQEYLDYLILKMWQVRIGFSEQAHSHSEALPSYQKLWLLPEHEADRQDNLAWLNDVLQETSRHFNASYKRVMGTSALILGDDLLQRVTRVIEQNKEALL